MLSIAKQLYYTCIFLFFFFREIHDFDADIANQQEIEKLRSIS